MIFGYARSTSAINWCWIQAIRRHKISCTAWRLIFSLASALPSDQVLSSDFLLKVGLNSDVSLTCTNVVLELREIRVLTCCRWATAHHRMRQKS